MKVKQLEESISKKKQQLNNVVQEFEHMHSSLSSIKHQFEKERRGNEASLSMLKSLE